VKSTVVIYCRQEVMCSSSRHSTGKNKKWWKRSYMGFCLLTRQCHLWLLIVKFTAFVISNSKDQVSVPGWYHVIVDFKAVLIAVWTANHESTPLIKAVVWNLQISKTLSSVLRCLWIKHLRHICDLCETARGVCHPVGPSIVFFFNQNQKLCGVAL